jgi:hypothetical protein
MKKFLLIVLFGCAGQAYDPAEECVELDVVTPILCRDPVKQGLFSSASCFTAEEAVEVLQGREEAMADGSCVVPEYFRQAEPRPQPEPVIISEYTEN